MSDPSSTDPSRSSTPNPVANARFTSQFSTTEDLLKSQTVGLVKLSDFRKRRAEVLERKEREAQDRSLGRLGAGRSGSTTPADSSADPQTVKKRRKNVAKGKLSFGLEEEDGEDSGTSAAMTPRSSTPDEKTANGSAQARLKQDQRRLGPNSSVGPTPKVLTKAALLREAQTREQLRKEFLAMQEAVKATDIAIPFVFYDGTDTAGGVCRVKKGDHVWLFLDKARKLGAELGVGGADRSKREWARVGVDDLLLVRGEIILPHHYEFYYFLVNKSIGFNGPIFNYSAEPTSTTPTTVALEGSDPTNFELLSKPGKKRDNLQPEDSALEGFNDDPSLTKVVDRRWYERNKHIFPASMWEEFDPTKDYSRRIRKDTEGNAFFFS